jgi:hypothetical protein
MNKPRSGISWGFAGTATGVLVIRNWYFLCSALTATCFVLLILQDSVRRSGDLDLKVLLSACGAYLLWLIYLEAHGVQVGQDTLTYPVRLGIGRGILPLFCKIVPMQQVLEASSLREAHGLRIAYLSGEFGQAKILFDTKAGRDRLFAVVKSKFPHIKVYRWS